jgi:hypothetical protein
VECKAGRAVTGRQPASAKQQLQAGLEVLQAIQSRMNKMDEATAATCLSMLALPTPAATISIAGPPMADRECAHRPMPSSAPAERLVKWLVTMLTTMPSAAQPRSGEAQMALQAFLNSLAMRELKEPASLASLTTHTVLTPLYHEEVSLGDSIDVWCLAINHDVCMEAGLGLGGQGGACTHAMNWTATYHVPGISCLFTRGSCPSAAGMHALAAPGCPLRSCTTPCCCFRPVHLPQVIFALHARSLAASFVKEQEELEAAAKAAKAAKTSTGGAGGLCIAEALPTPVHILTT